LDGIADDLCLVTDGQQAGSRASEAISIMKPTGC
jgi:hypothetical protein